MDMTSEKKVMTKKKCRQIFGQEKCTLPEKILATPMMIDEKNLASCTIKRSYLFARTANNLTSLPGCVSDTPCLCIHTAKRMKPNAEDKRVLLAQILAISCNVNL